MSLTLHTNYGDIKVELNCEDTPRTCPSPQSPRLKAVYSHDCRVD